MPDGGAGNPHDALARRLIRHADTLAAQSGGWPGGVAGTAGAVDDLRAAANVLLAHGPIPYVLVVGYGQAPASVVDRFKAAGVVRPVAVFADGATLGLLGHSLGSLVDGRVL